ncbi:tetratricopeptide repeat protein [Pseudomonas citronellolis]|uniref:O-linked N-acetylglucosamine transferase, SPINDLY family protein n=1 Tax=Pseudomonas citronellolis TaxID=53408 RepID=UPI0023E39337|nr:tetratricopeptide repeat protein [Pseudomonas citronellolis]MDF3933330.1 tetratricopeptide repeat protein [Pseudomonas citronellolis]
MNRKLHPIVTALNSGAPRRAEAQARQLLCREPRNAEAQHLLGVACMQQGKLDEARTHFIWALALREDPDYHLNLALTLQRLGDDAAALQSLQQVLRLAPDNVQAANNLANLYAKRGDTAQAEQALRQALAHRPGYALACQNLGILLRGQRRLAEAETLLRQALALTPGSATAVIELAALLRETGRLDNAEALLRQAAAGVPPAPQVLVELALLLEQRKRYGEAITLLHRARQWGDLQRLLRTQADWRALAAADRAVLDQLGNGNDGGLTPWGLLNLPELGAMAHREAGRRFALRRWGRELELPPALLEAAPADGCLRIGYLSCDFYDHATLHLLMGVLEAHDARRVEVQLFDFSPRRIDPLTRRLAILGLPRHNLRELSDEAAARLIAEQRLHLLVDLKGFTHGARPGICARRPAPVIVNWLGYPGSLGHPRLADYLIGDALVSPPEHSACFSETLALLPHCYQSNDRERALPAPPSREAAGLPEHGLVFCNFNQLLKLNPSEFDHWCQLLNEVPGSLLWLLDPECAQARANLWREAGLRGIAAERLVFAPRLSQVEHLARLQLADLALDCFPCTSHTTASDLLWAGVPLVTRVGATFASRVAASLLSAHGFAELVCVDAASAYRLARELAEDGERRAALRERLAVARRESPLFDTTGFTRHLEALYRAIWQRHRTAPQDHSPVFAETTPQG